jgi:pyridoxal biosynthesis lyase PdxS
MLVKISEDVGEAMPGLSVEDLEVRLQDRGW